MGYFNSFPLITYNLSKYPAQSPLSLRNIFFRLKILDTIKKNALIYYPYYVKDNETPEIIAYKYYNDASKHWLVMLANDIVDPQYDWPLDYNSFIRYIASKYGSTTDIYLTPNGPANLEDPYYLGSDFLLGDSPLGNDMYFPTDPDYLYSNGPYYLGNNFRLGRSYMGNVNMILADPTGISIAQKLVHHYEMTM